MVTSTSQRLLEPIPSIIKNKLPFKLLMLGEWSRYKTSLHLLEVFCRMCLVYPNMANYFLILLRLVLEPTAFVLKSPETYHYRERKAL